MRLHPSARRWIAAVALFAGASSVIDGCNSLLGTPEPALEADSGPEAGHGQDAATDVDATSTQDGTTVGDAPDAAAPDDTTTEDALDEDATSDAPVEDSSAQDVVVPDEGDDAAPPVPPSCAADAGGAGVTSCGTTGESCCTSVAVDAGTYYRTYTVSNGTASGFGYQATVSAFRLDKYEVTVGRFRQFVAAAKTWTPPTGSGIHGYLRDGGGLEQIVDGAASYETGWDPSWNADLSQVDGGGAGHWDTTLTSCAPESTWTNFPSTQESLPINCVNWYEAYAFCIWDGGFLPSEAEWEYVAAGGMDQREYPWGNTDPGVSNQYAIYGCNYPDGGQLGVDAAGTCNSVANIAPVGSAPLGAGKWAQLDLGGNVNEKTFDWYDVDYELPCDDCANLTPDPGAFPGRSSRGGSWWVQPGAMLGYARTEYTPVTRDYKGGIRCARAP